MKLNAAEDVSLNTESCGYLNSLVQRAYQDRFRLLSDGWKDCDLLVKLVVLMLNSPSDQVKQSLLIDRQKAFGEPYKKEKRFKNEMAL